MASVLTPPGPLQQGAENNLEEFNRDPLGFLLHCARTYGGVVGVRFDSPFYLLNRPDLVEEVLQNRQGLFTKTIHAFDHGAAHDPQSVKYTAFGNLLGQGLLTSDGDDWRRRRRILADPFHPRVTTGYAGAIVSVIERLIADWDGLDTLDVYEQMRELTLGVVGSTLMGCDLSGQAEDEGRAFKAALEHFYHPSGDGPGFHELLSQLHGTTDAIVADRRANPSGGDLLGRLLHDESAAGLLSDEDLRNELMTLLFAGHETTANALCWTWVLLAQHPRQEERLLNELREVLGGRSPAAEDLDRLPYAQMVVSESLRLWPPVWFLGRFLQRDWQVGEYVLPAGSGVMVSPWVMHRDEHYFLDPGAFEPERWADGLERRLPRGAYFPFGDGPRICIGWPLALLEIQLAVAVIAQRYRLSLAPGQTVEPEALNTIRPKGGLILRLEGR